MPWIEGLVVTVGLNVCSLGFHVCVPVGWGIVCVHWLVGVRVFLVLVFLAW